VRGLQARKTFKKITKAIDSGLVKACHDLSEGGLGVAAAEMAIGGGFGIQLDLRKVQKKDVDRDDFVLFSESNSRFLVEIPQKATVEFEALMKDVVCAKIGRVTKNAKFSVQGLNGATIVEASIADLRKSWKGTLSSGVRKA
ncbi:phosphoribosylformylglycinamidine synthase, partial [Candidatus Bathyarchaeota archaeon]